MEAVYQNISSKGTASVGGIEKWLQDSNMIGKSEDAKAKFTEAFSSVSNKEGVSLEEFKDAMSKLAAAGVVNTEALISSISGAASSAAGKLLDAMGSKK